MEIYRMAGARLSRDERARVEAGIAVRESDVVIAEAIGRHRTTVWREIAAGGGRDAYRATVAQAGATERAKRPRDRLLAAAGELAELVAGRLALRWSPHAIVAWLRAKGGHRVCAETIYQACYQGIGPFAGGWRQLVCGRARRRGRRRGETARRNVLGDIVNVSARPAAAAERTEAGHWEGDLVKGAYNRSGVVTLVERVSHRTCCRVARRRP
jgi:IS30 family transposase